MPSCQQPGPPPVAHTYMGCPLAGGSLPPTHQEPPASIPAGLVLGRGDKERGCAVLSIYTRPAGPRSSHTSSTVQPATGQPRPCSGQRRRPLLGARPPRLATAPIWLVCPEAPMGGRELSHAQHPLIASAYTRDTVVYGPEWAGATQDARHWHNPPPPHNVTAAPHTRCSAAGCAPAHAHLLQSAAA